MSVIIDLVNDAITARALPPQTLAATTQGSAIDFARGEIATNMVVDVGSITVANVTSLVVQCEECATTNGTFTVIPGMVITVTATTTEANLHQVTRGLRTSRYVRANANTLAAATTTGAFPCSVEIIAQKKDPAPSGKESGVDRSPST